MQGKKAKFDDMFTGECEWSISVPGLLSLLGRWSCKKSQSDGAIEFRNRCDKLLDVLCSRSLHGLDFHHITSSGVDIHFRNGLLDIDAVRKSFTHVWTRGMWKQESVAASGAIRSLIKCLHMPARFSVESNVERQDLFLAIAEAIAMATEFHWVPAETDTHANLPALRLCEHCSM